MVASTLDFAYETQKYGIFWAQDGEKNFLDFSLLMKSSCWYVEKG